MAKGQKTGGRQLGVVNRATAELKQLAQEHTEDALKIIVSIMEDVGAPIASRLAAAETIIERGHGKARETPPSVDIVQRFATGQISAIQCGLELESHGLKAGALLSRYIQNELAIMQHTNPMEDGYSVFDAPKPLSLPVLDVEGLDV